MRGTPLAVDVDAEEPLAAVIVRWQSFIASITLSVRVDDLRHPLALKAYVKKWMKDYTRFGFEVLTAKPVKVNENQAFLLDIVSRETQKQLRQVVFLREKTAVILTCRDGRESFAKTVLDCNEIMKTFEWVN
jgi:hypothetical protein